MVDLIFRLTVAAVLMLAVLNTVQGVALLGRLAGHVARRYPHRGLDLWLPVFTSVDDIRAWIDAWRDVLRLGDPVLTQLRAAGRTLVSRHVHLALLSYAWAMTVSAVAPSLA